MASGRAWGARFPARISLIVFGLFASGCATTDSTGPRGAEPLASAANSDSCYQDAKRIFKRAMVEFGDNRWSEVSDAATRLAAVARRWNEFAPVDKSKNAEHLKLVASLVAAADRLAAASNKHDSAAVAAAFGQIAADLSKLGELNPPLPTGGVWT